MRGNKIITTPSVIRLDRMFWANNLNTRSNSHITLNDEILKIIYYQFKIAYGISCSNESDENIKALEEILQEEFNNYRNLNSR